MNIFQLKDRTVTISRYRKLSLEDSFKNAVNTSGLNRFMKESILVNFDVYGMDKAMKIFKTQLIKEGTSSVIINTIFYDIFNPTGITISSLTLKLKGVNDIKITYVSDVSVSTGLMVSFIHPWYIKPVDITISGHSYSGSYSTSKSDKDVEEFYNIYNGLQGEGNLLQNQDRILLTIENNPRGIDRFFGFFSKFDFNESITQPYLLNYNIDFVGTSDFTDALSTGPFAAKKDKAKKVS